MAASSTARPRGHASREVRRAQILDAALHCFSERGYHATSMDDLVRASGLSKGSLYWHFQSKEDVFLALLDQFLEHYFADWRALDDGSRPIREVVRAGGELAVAVFQQDPKLMRAWVEFIAHPAAQARFAEVYRRSREQLVALIERGVATGEFRDVAPEGTAVTLIAATEGLLLQASVDDDFDPSLHFPHVMDVLEGGLLR